ncbi:sensor histidine kinase [Marinagarivorans cellulosilyticus]|uniref:histidine kinase n=1 Tax=Marinagarivorans cellulosilyticus TaxID=2721545 RepID=A0AAN2BIX6_9GAMM|nr:ATP-binding protein [Marinagarivorans cellulosilyticus]BCD96363.1 two-component system, OmpR family, phosphate regulon sensor histidine kinase PhoR [Marinagarivorans cellulosilyticus]
MTMLTPHNKVHLRESYNILVVDDNEIDRATTCHMLSLGKDAEYVITAVDSVNKAEAYLADPKNIIDLAFLDYQLIDKTAEDVLQIMQRYERDIPVIVATSFATKRKENQLLKYGIYDFWDKNLLNPASLEHSIRFALNRHQLSQTRYHSQLLQGETLASVIHDLKNPISTIESYNKIAKRLVDKSLSASGDVTDSDSERVDICFDTIEKNCQLLQHLVEEILELSKSQAEQQSFPKQSVSINNILRACIQNFTPKAQECNLKLSTNISDKDFVIQGNKDKLTQVFNNLISNAIKYTDNGKITVGLSEQLNKGKPVAHITLQDTGIGIDAKNLDTIFKPFNHIEHKTQKKVDSHGLGLSIVKNLVEQHEGKIYVVSTKGEGSKFTVELPLE